MERWGLYPHRVARGYRHQRDLGRDAAPGLVHSVLPSLTKRSRDLQLNLC